METILKTNNFNKMNFAKSISGIIGRSTSKRAEKNNIRGTIPTPGLDNIMTRFQHFYVIDPTNHSFLLTNDPDISDSKLNDLKCYQVLHNESKPCNSKEFLCPLREINSGRSYVSCQHKCTRKIDCKKTYQVDAYPIFDKHREKNHVIVYRSEINKYKISQYLADEIDSKFHNIIKQSTDSVIVVQHGLIKYINKQSQRQFGYSLDEFYEAPFTSFISSNNASDILNYFSLFANDTSNEISFDTEFKHKNGELLLKNIKIKHVELKGDGIDIITIREPSSRNYISENKFRESIHEIINNTSDSIFILDEKGQFIDVNNSTLDMYKYEKNEIIGQNFNFILSPEENNSEKISEIIQQTFDNEQKQFECIGLTKNGEKLLLRIQTKKGKYFNNDVLFAYVQDISYFKKTEKQLMEANEKAQESEKLKTSFLANLQHEIRTPLNAIVGFSQFLSDPEIDNGEREEFTDRLNQGTDNLLKVMNSIIEMSQLEIKNIDITKTKFEVKQVLTEIYDSHRKSLKKNSTSKNVDFRLIFPDCSKQIMLHTDLYRFKQVFDILIENAIKYTKSGIIEFGIMNCDTESNIRFIVSDTGIGIPEDKLSIIFNKFRQSDESNTRQYGGLGLGLALLSKIIELIGGKIQVKSTVGEGTTFLVDIPIA